jgi:hypothetical protein
VARAARSAGPLSVPLRLTVAATCARGALTHQRSQHDHDVLEFWENPMFHKIVNGIHHLNSSRLHIGQSSAAK